MLCVVGCIVGCSILIVVFGCDRYRKLRLEKLFVVVCLLFKFGKGGVGYR